MREQGTDSPRSPRRNSKVTARVTAQEQNSIWKNSQGAGLQRKLPSTSGLQLRCRASLGHPDAWGGRGYGRVRQRESPPSGSLAEDPVFWDAPHGKQGREAETGPFVETWGSHGSLLCFKVLLKYFLLKEAFPAL